MGLRRIRGNKVSESDLKTPRDITIKFSNGNKYQYHSHIIAKHSNYLKYFIDNGEKIIELSETYDCPELFNWMYGSDIILYPEHDVLILSDFNIENFIKIYKSYEYYQMNNNLIELIFNSMIMQERRVMFALLKKPAPIQLIKMYLKTVGDTIRFRWYYEIIEKHVINLNLHELSLDELSTLLQGIECYLRDKIIILDIWIHETNNNDNRGIIIPKFFDKSDLRELYNVIIEPWKSQFTPEFKLGILEDPIAITTDDLNNMRKKRGITYDEPDEAIRKYIRYNHIETHKKI